MRHNCFVSVMPFSSFYNVVMFAGGFSFNGWQECTVGLPYCIFRGKTIAKILLMFYLLQQTRVKNKFYCRF